MTKLEYENRNHCSLRSTHGFLGFILLASIVFRIQLLESNDTAL
jgi:cytochrome b561